MSERMGRAEAVKATVGNFVRYAGAVVTGKLVLAPVRAETYGARVQSFLDSGDPGYVDSAKIIDTALRRAPQSLTDERAFERHYGLPETHNHWDALADV